MRALLLGVVLGALVFVSPAAAAGLLKSEREHAPALASAPRTLVQLNGNAADPVVALSGGELVSRDLRIWRLPRAAAERLLPRLERTGALALAEPERTAVRFSHLSDPLVPTEWWVPRVGADRAEPPGPGVPVTVLDTGLDLTHPEFAGRPNTTALDQQSVFGDEEVHGTAVSSTAAAPTNGVGLVGVYPRAALQEYDFGRGSLGDMIAGLAAASHTRSVINISSGFFGYSRLLERAVDRALRRGSIVVAAAGNDRQNRSRPVVPAVLPHVLTIAATDQLNRVAFFSSASPALDLAAPGQDIPVAVPRYFNSSGYDVFDGTSFSSPLVAGAAAWVWTVRPQLQATQILELMRRSARDIPPPGWDGDTGWGMLDIPNALATATPPRDPQEPNEDVYAVRPGGMTSAGTSPLTRRGRGRAAIRAFMDYTEDPEDIYRIWLPAKRQVVVRIRGDRNVDLALWGPRTRTIFERGQALKRDLLDFSQRKGTRVDVVTARSTGRRGTFIYADAFLPRGVADAAYTITVSTPRR
jgi:hypothetical protein